MSGLTRRPIELGQEVSVPRKSCSSAVSRREVRQFLVQATLRSEPVPAVDVWSAGVILLFFLCKKFPLFQANDDVEALMEIAVVLGRRRMDGWS